MMKDFKKRLNETSALGPIGPLRPGPRHARNHASGRAVSAAGPAAVLASPILRNDQRGLVIFPPVRLSEDTVESTGPLDPQVLRFALLFWDQIDLPQGAIAFDGGPDVDYLARIGVLNRSAIRNSAGTPDALVRETHVAAFRALEARDPGKWSLGRSEDSMGFRHSDLVAGRGVLVELFQAIPLPSKDVPIDDLLQFKEKRRSELLALRHHLGAIYQQILNSGDQPLAKIDALDSLDLAIANVLKVSTESRLKMLLASIEARLELENKIDLKQGLLATTAAMAAGFGLVGSVLAGLGVAVVPSLSLKNSVGLKGANKSPTPFEYVSKVHRELF